LVRSLDEGFQDEGFIKGGCSQKLKSGGVHGRLENPLYGN
jgi:hypothetical protein